MADGGRDWRILGIAAGIWFSALVTQTIVAFLWHPSSQNIATPTQESVASSHGGVHGVPARTVPGLPVLGEWGSSAWWSLLGLPLAVALMVALYAFVRRRATPGRIRVPVTVLAIVCAMLLSALASLCASLSERRDSAMVLARRGAGAVTAQWRVTAPAIVSTLRQARCQADARMLSVSHRGVRTVSSVRVRVFAHGDDCARLVQGAVVSGTGTLRMAEYGSRPLWLVLSEGQAVRTVRPPDALRMAVHRMREALFRVCEGLDDQGRMLVPGLTMGIVGSQHVGSSDRPIDATYAASLQERFRQSGIMHLMAVSGGHFMVVAAVVRRLGARLLMPRRMVAALMALTGFLLAQAMYPSDSVLRAEVMLVLHALALWYGRPSQSMNALGWTVSFILLSDPGMARSYGFALSCAAVLGILLCTARVGACLATLLPRLVAAVAAVTVSAQLFTMPVQVLMEPQLPLLSVPANLLVAPVVDVATIAGLAAMCVAPFSTSAAFPLAWVSGCGTALMQWCATVMGQSHTVVPWMHGPSGAMLMVSGESAIAAMCWMGGRIMRRRHGRRGCLQGGTPYRSSGMRALERWFADTVRLVNAMDGAYARSGRSENHDGHGLLPGDVSAHGGRCPPMRRD